MQSKVHYQTNSSTDGSPKEGALSSSEAIPRNLTPSSTASSSNKPTNSRGSSRNGDPNSTIAYASPTKDDVKKQAMLARLELEKSSTSNHATIGSSTSTSSSSSNVSTLEATVVVSPSVGSASSSSSSSTSSVSLTSATLAAGENSPTFDCTKGLKFSKFTGFYSPTYSAAFSSKSRDSSKHVDPELVKILKEEFDSENVKLHKKKDWMKTYSDEAVKYAALLGISRGDLWRPKSKHKNKNKNLHKV